MGWGSLMSCGGCVLVRAELVYAVGSMAEQANDTIGASSSSQAQCVEPSLAVAQSLYVLAFSEFSNTPDAHTLHPGSIEAFLTAASDIGFFLNTPRFLSWVSHHLPSQNLNHTPHSGMNPFSNGTVTLEPISELFM